jgi:hypothetical protein
MTVTVSYCQGGNNRGDGLLVILTVGYQPSLRFLELGGLKERYGMDKELEKKTLIEITERQLKYRRRRFTGVAIASMVGWTFGLWLVDLMAHNASDIWPYTDAGYMPYFFLVCGAIIYAGICWAVAAEWKLIGHEYAKLAVIKGEVEVPVK